MPRRGHCQRHCVGFSKKGVPTLKSDVGLQLLRRGQVKPVLRREATQKGSPWRQQPRGHQPLKCEIKRGASAMMLQEKQQHICLPCLLLDRSQVLDLNYYLSCFLPRGRQDCLVHPMNTSLCSSERYQVTVLINLHSRRSGDWKHCQYIHHHTHTLFFPPLLYFFQTAPSFLD